MNIKNNNYNLIPLTFDHMFKKIFIEDKTKLKSFIQSVIKRKVLSIEFLPNEQIGNYKDSKKGIVDILALIEEANGVKKQVNIEVQVKYIASFTQRSFFYFCRAFQSSMGDSKDYKDCIPVIQIILVVNKQLKRNTYHSIAKIKFEDIKKEEFVDFKYIDEDEYLHKDIEFHIVELNKFKKKNINVISKLDLWLLLFLGNEEKILEYVEIDKEFKEVYEKMKYLSINDHETRALYENELKYLRDEYTNKAEKDRIIAETEKLEAENDKLEAKNNKLEDDNNTLEAKNNKLEDDNNKLEAKNNRLEDDKILLKTTLVKVLISQNLNEDEILKNAIITLEELEEIKKNINNE